MTESLESDQPQQVEVIFTDELLEILLQRLRASGQTIVKTEALLAVLKEQEKLRKRVKALEAAVEILEREDRSMFRGMQEIFEQVDRLDWRIASYFEDGSTRQWNDVMGRLERVNALESWGK